MDSFQGAHFAEEPARLDATRNWVARRSVKRQPQASAEDKIDVAVALSLGSDPSACRGPEPSTLAIKIVARFWVERFEARMDCK